MKQLVLVFAVTSALEILVYQPLLMPSHVKFMGRLVDVLVDHGHNVTVLVSVHRPDVAHGCDRAKEIVTFTSEEVVVADIKPDLGWVTVATPASQWKAMRPLGVPLGKQCKALLNSEILLQLRNRHFDVLIHEVFDMCGLALMLSLNLEKHVIVSSTRQMDTVGYELGLLSPMRDAAILSDYGSVVPWSAVFRNVDFIRSYIKFTDIQQDFYRKELRFLNFTRNLKTLIRGASAVFLNTHPLADTWRASLRNVYDIGGIGLQQPMPLNSDLASVLANWRKIVLISFGTVVPSAYMPTPWKLNVRNVIRSFPEVLFLWKYEENDEFFADSRDSKDKILFSPFFPQNDLLGSGLINLFITHGGQNSVLEAANTGVPMLVVPQFGDQFRNAKAVEERQLGRIFDKTDLCNFNAVKTAITEMLAQRSFQNNKVAGAISVEAASREFVSRLVESVRSPLTFEEGPAQSDVLALFDFGWMVVCAASAIAVASFSIAVVYNTLQRRHLSQEKAHQSQ